MTVSASTAPVADGPGLSFPAELCRKAVHLTSLWIPLLVLYAGAEAALWILAPLAALALAVDVLRARSVTCDLLMSRLFGAMLRDRERRPAPRPVHLLGSTWMLVGAVATFACFPLPAGVAAFAMLIVGDTAAALVGRRWGRRRFAWGKSLEGCAAFFAVSWPAAMAVPGVGAVAAAVGALAGTIAEALPGPCDDNLRVPLLAAAAIAAATTLGG